MAGMDLDSIARWIEDEGLDVRMNVEEGRPSTVITAVACGVIVRM